VQEEWARTTSASAASIAILLLATALSSGARFFQVSGKSGRTIMTSIPTQMVSLRVVVLDGMLGSAIGE